MPGWKVHERGVITDIYMPVWKVQRAESIYAWS